MAQYEAVIGLEVHAQLLTKSKIFCGCSTKFGAPPNTQTCPVCLVPPGVLSWSNREGVPLIEIVSEPDIRTPEDAVSYLKKLREIVRYLEICDGNMEEGSFRCDANVSIRLAGEKALGTKAEVKNMNSFRYVQKALEYEISRQTGVVEGGGRIVTGA